MQAGGQKVTLNTAVSLAGAVFLAALVAVFSAKRIWRGRPVFFGYLIFGFCAALVAAATQRYIPRVYLSEWIVEACADALFYICVLVELGRNLVRFNHKGPPPWQFVILLFALNGVVLHAFSRWSLPFHFPVAWQFAVHTMQATAVLELAALLVVVEWSAFGGLRWPDREFRIVTGFGFSGVVSMAAAMLYSYPFIYTHGRFTWMNLLAPVADLGVLVYWLKYFALKDGGEKKSQALPGEFAYAGNRDRRDDGRDLTAAHAVPSVESKQP